MDYPVCEEGDPGATLQKTGLLGSGTCKSVAPSLKARGHLLPPPSRSLPFFYLQSWDDKPGTRGEPNAWCEFKPRYFRRPQDLVEGVCDYQARTSIPLDPVRVNKYVSVGSRSKPWPMFCVCENGCVHCSVPGVLSQTGGWQRRTGDRATLTGSL